MTRDETIAIMGVLKTAYPQYYKNMNRREAEDVIALWHEMFMDDPSHLVSAAVKSFITTDSKGFPPHIGAIKQQIVKLQAGNEMSELEAWAQVKNALKNSNYFSDREFEKLDPIIQRIVGASSQLRQWALMDADTLDTVVGSNFQRSYRAVVRAEREYMALPCSVKKVADRPGELVSFSDILGLPEQEGRHENSPD